MADAETLRIRLARKPIVVAPGVYDALTAHLAARAGFSTLYVSGAAIAYTRLGRPDIGLVALILSLMPTPDTATRLTSLGQSACSSARGRERSSSKIRHFPSAAGTSTT